MAGFVTRTGLDSDALPADAAQALAEIAERALAAPAAPAGERLPDELLYTIEIGDGDRTRSLRFSEQTLPEEMRELIAWVDSRPERADTVEPAGR